MICFYAMLIGFPIIRMKKYILKKQIETVARSNIIIGKIINPPPTPEESIQMETFHSKARIIHIEPINVIYEDDIENKSNDRKSCVSVNDFINNSEQVTNPIQKTPMNLMFNTSKYNKNLINSTGIILIAVMLIIIVYFPFASAMGWIGQRERNVYIWVLYCCIPVLLPTIYFMHQPKHLIKVLNDL